MFRHTEDMGEISGFGGGCEQACQDMLEAGCKWIEANKSAKLEGHSYSGVEAAIFARCRDRSGVFHNVVMSRLFYIAANGWDKYCEEVRSKVAEKSA